MTSMNTTFDEYQQQQMMNQNRTCGWLFNCWDMCFSNSLLDQNKLFEDHMNRMNNTAANHSNQSSPTKSELSIEVDQDEGNQHGRTKNAGV
jgi:hypothetical protein